MTIVCIIAGDIDCNICTTVESAPAIFVAKGMMAAPIRSRKSPHAFLSCCTAPSPVRAAASACPPNLRSNSSRIIACALAMSPVSASFLITSVCSLEKVMPARDSDESFVAGSESALPNCNDAEPKSISNAVARSNANACVRLKFSPVMLVKANRRAVDLSRIVSSPKSVLPCNSEA